MTVVRCPAKLNLTLAVGPRRDDGFHDLESLVAPIALFDELRITPREAGLPGVPRFALTCDDPTIPLDSSNLVLRAADALVTRRPDAPLPLLLFELRKRIPAGAGLGGGSSNAAGALRALADMCARANHPIEQRAIEQIAAELGSDVPLFLANQPVVMRGRGERVTPVQLPTAGFAVVALPAVHCSTAAVYAAFDGLPPPAAHVAPEEIVRQARSVADLMALGSNDLQEPAFRVAPELRALHTALNAHAPFRITGSGSALFSLVNDSEHAAGLAAEVSARLHVRCEAAALAWA